MVLLNILPCFRKVDVFHQHLGILWLGHLFVRSFIIPSSFHPMFIPLLLFKLGHDVHCQVGGPKNSPKYIFQGSNPYVSPNIPCFILCLNDVVHFINKAILNGIYFQSHLLLRVRFLFISEKHLQLRTWKIKCALKLVGNFNLYTLR